jgi:putative flippase GtrA
LEQSARSGWSRDFLQFTAFLVSGGIAAACNIGSRALLNLFLSYEVSIVLAYVVGMVVAFTIMRMFVFKSATESSKRAQFVKFSIVNVLGLAQTLAISELVARWAAPALGFQRHAETIGHVMGVGAPVVTSYFGHKYFSFRKAKTET